MNIYEFNLENTNGRAQLVWDHGEWLANRNNEDEFTHLYNMGTFFAEITYHSKENRIVDVRAFKAKVNLEPYLDQITLDDLL